MIFMTALETSTTCRSSCQSETIGTGLPIVVGNSITTCGSASDLESRYYIITQWGQGIIINMYPLQGN